MDMPRVLSECLVLNLGLKLTLPSIFFVIVSGLRFAIISAKMAMVTLLKNFKFSICDKTNDPIKIDKRTFLLKAEGGLWVRLEKI